MASDVATDLECDLSVDDNDSPCKFCLTEVSRILIRISGS